MLPMKKKVVLTCSLLTALLSAQSIDDNPFYFDEAEEKEQKSSVTHEAKITSDDKTAVKRIVDPQDILKSVRGVYYTWNTNKYPDSDLPRNRQSGVVTEDLSSLLPGYMTSDDNGVPQINTEALIGLLVEVIKEQQIEIEELQSSFIRLKSDQNQTDHEKTNYLNQVQELQRDMNALKELIGNPVVNVHFHYDDKKKKHRKEQPEMAQIQ